MALQEIITRSYGTHVIVFTTAIDHANWTAISIPSTTHCDSALCKCRTSTNKWYLAHLSGGDPYITFEAAGSFTLDITKSPSDVLFYVKGTAASDTFEVILSRR